MAKQFSLAEAGAQLDVSPATLGIQARKGVLHARKVGRDYFVTQAEIDRYRAEHKSGTPRPKPDPAEALALALADHGYVDPDPIEQHRLIDVGPILATLRRRGFAVTPVR